MVDLLDCLHLRLNGRVFRLRLLVSFSLFKRLSFSRIVVVAQFFFNSLHLSLSLMEDREEDTEASKSSKSFRSERSFVGGSRASIDR